MEGQVSRQAKVNECVVEGICGQHDDGRDESGGAEDDSSYTPLWEVIRAALFWRECLAEKVLWALDARQLPSSDACCARDASDGRVYDASATSRSRRPTPDPDRDAVPEK